MLPYIISTPYFSIPTYGIFIVLGIFWGAYVLWRNVRLTSYKEEDVFDTTLFASFCGIVLARIMHVGLYYHDFLDKGINGIIDLHLYPGLDWFGFLLGASIGFVLFARWRKIPALEVADYVAPAVVIAAAFIKLGAFFGGVEVGTQTDFIVRLKYANFDGLRHTTALYSSIFLFAVFCLMQRILLRIRQEKHGKGFLVALLYWSYALQYILFYPMLIHLEKLSLPLPYIREILAISVVLTSAVVIVYDMKPIFNTYGRSIRKKTTKKTA